MAAEPGTACRMRIGDQMTESDAPYVYADGNGLVRFEVESPDDGTDPVSVHLSWPGDGGRRRRGRFYNDLWLSQLPPETGTTATFYMRNYRTGVRTSVVTKSTTSLIGGTTAEWIVERDTNTVTGIPDTLANYVSMDMRLAAARQGTKLFWYSGVPSVPGVTDLRSVNVTMTNAGGTALSTVAARDANSMTFTWQARA
jgi:hypothetical protein